MGVISENFLSVSSVLHMKKDYKLGQYECRVELKGAASKSEYFSVTHNLPECVIAKAQGVSLQKKGVQSYSSKMYFFYGFLFADLGEHF